MGVGGGGVGLGTAYGRVIIDASGVRAAVNEARSTLTGGMQNLGATLSGVGRDLMTLTAPLAAFGATGVKTAGDFQSAMLEVAARTGLAKDEIDRLDGAGRKLYGTLGDTYQPIDSMERLRQTAIRLGADTIFSANDAAEAMLQLLTSGMNVEDTLAALPAIMDGAAAGATDLGFTADAVTDIMNQFGLKAEDARLVVDTLVKASANGSATFDDLAFALRRSGGVADMYGLSIEETAAVLQIFSENGLKGEIAGRQLRSMLRQMTSDNKDVVNTWRRLGISLYDAEGHMRPLAAIMEDLNTKLSKLSDRDRIQVIKTLGGSFGEMGLNALLTGGNITLMLEAMDNSADAATVAASMMSGWKGAVENLRGSLESLQIEVLTPFMENTLTPLVNKLADVVNLITLWAQANPELAQKIVGFVALLLALGPVLWVAGKFFSTTASLIKGVGTALGMLFTPVGLAALLIIGLAYAYYTNLGGIRDFIDNEVSPVLRDFLNLIGVDTDTAIKVALGALALLILALWGVPIPALAAAGAIWSVVAGVLGLLGPIGLAILAIIALVVAYFLNLGGLRDFVDKKVGPALGDFLKMLADAWKYVRPGMKIFKSIVNLSFESIIQKIVEATLKLVEFIEKLKGLPREAGEALGGILPTIGDIAKPFVTNDVNAPSLVLSTPAGFNGGAGFRAGGGDVLAGLPYVVGERGPELFVPRESGTIVPNDKLGTTYNLSVGQVVLPPSDNPQEQARSFLDALQEEIDRRG